MRNRKRMFVDFAFFDRTGIQRFLEKQARKGWMLKSASGASWQFERIEPKEIHFSVNYFPDASMEDDEPSQQHRMFLDLCEYSGWMRIKTVGPMHIFYNESEHPVPIETDPLVELETIHKAVKKVYLQPRVMYFAFGFFYLLLYVWRYSISPLETQNSNYHTAMAWYGLGLAAWSLFELFQYYIWRKKARRAAELNGTFEETRSYPFVGISILIGCECIMLSRMIADLGAVIYVVLVAVLVFTVILCVMVTLIHMKSEKYKTLQLQVLMLCFIGIGILFALMLIAVFYPVFQEVYR